ncbi:MAG: hypothetical protein A2Z83_02895 [Omnitrophica bacterium GWA2_52_8]|nr:MAG: hypothetical protein A2Z83_02895 [Omnitrophica bacterium GWA2_52_8]
MKKLLIIDDEEGIVQEVRDYFSEEGWEVYSAYTGKKGLDLLNEVKGDVLILDIKLPDMSGVHLLKISKELQPAMKVILNTGYVDQSTFDDVEKLKPDAFLQKPFNLMKLSDEVSRLSKAG